MKEFEQVFRNISEDEFEEMMRAYARERHGNEDCRECPHNVGEVNKDYLSGDYFALCDMTKAPVVRVRKMCDCEFLKNNKK